MRQVAKVERHLSRETANTKASIRNLVFRKLKDNVSTAQRTQTKSRPKR